MVRATAEAVVAVGRSWASCPDITLRATRAVQAHAVPAESETCRRLTRMHSAGWVSGPPEVRRDRGRARLVAAAMFVVLLVVVAALGVIFGPERNVGAVDRPDGVDAVIAAGAPSSWDPARIGDAGSAATLAQVYEGLTALDAADQVRPALAASWDTADDGRMITFHLRDGLTFSDGSPLTASDVVASWLRVLDPAHPSPLVDLLGDVSGASAYAAGTGSAADVGLRANGKDVIVTFRRPAAYFASTAASPTLAIVPPNLPASADGPDLPSDLVVSGAYVPTSENDTDIRLEANRHYWAGPPSLSAIDLVTSLQDQSPVAGLPGRRCRPRGDRARRRLMDRLRPGPRAAAARAERHVGRLLRVRHHAAPLRLRDVRRAFAQAVDWKRIVTLDDPTATPATSLVPPGVAGRGEEDFVLPYDPDAARASLATAGYPGGKGFPAVTLVTDGGGYEDAVVQQLSDTLGITVTAEAMPFDEYGERLADDPPQMWSLEWVADYPHAQDFLGLLLQTGSANNFGHWSNADFDASLDAAASTADPTEQAAHYADAERIVQQEVPLIPLRYGETWALSRDGLLGAEETAVGFMRMAGLTWAAGH